VQLGAGHPQRTMLLAFHLYDRLDDEGASEQIVTDVVATALAELDDVFASLWAGLNRGERAVVVAISDGLRPVSTKVADEHAVARSTLQRAFERLVTDGRLVARGTDRPTLIDPLFAEWLRRR
jgi:hypothetical protein